MPNYDVTDAELAYARAQMERYAFMLEYLHRVYPQPYYEAAAAYQDRIYARAHEENNE